MSVCMYCDRPTKDNWAVCNRIKCKLKAKWENYRVSRTVKRDIKAEKKLIGDLLPQEYCIATIYHKDFPNDTLQCSRKPKGLYVYCWQHQDPKYWSH